MLRELYVCLFVNFPLHLFLQKTCHPFAIFKGLSTFEQVRTVVKWPTYQLKSSHLKRHLSRIITNFKKLESSSHLIVSDFAERNEGGLCYSLCMCDLCQLFFLSMCDMCLKLDLRRWKTNLKSSILFCMSHILYMDYMITNLIVSHLTKQQATAFPGHWFHILCKGFPHAT